ASATAAASNQAAVAAAIARVKARQMQAKGEAPQSEQLEAARDNTESPQSAPAPLTPLSPNKGSAILAAGSAVTSQEAQNAAAPNNAPAQPVKIGVAPVQQPVKIPAFSAIKLQATSALANAQAAAPSDASSSPKQPQEDN
ncbi:MAG: hypothetical protein ACRC1U_02835, partial [Vibrionaceae bacterium]